MQLVKNYFIQLTAAPIDGLKIGADYAAAGNETGVVDELSGGNTLSMCGNLKFGIMQGYKESGKATYADGDGYHENSCNYDHY